jgi:16S rRNA (cytidine1402-2'-O)-methyltransferase
MLLLVSTPIGNLGDISFRAIEALKNADLILCEDTRHSKILLNHYGIRKPVASYHQFNEQKKIAELIDLLLEGKNLCLISDAGTPLIADPGFPLVKACIDAKIEVSAIPGPCALIQALICSGLTWERFQFVGFLPKKERELRVLLNDLVAYPGVSIAYETPHRIVETIAILASIQPSVRICIARELTKLDETYLRGIVSELLSEVQQNPPRGESVLLIQGEKETPDYSTLSLEEHVQEVQTKYGVSKREAIKIVAELRDINKRLLYSQMHLKN